MKWQKAIKTGKQAEHKVCKKIKRKYPKAFVIKGYNPEFDIYVPEVDYKIEVKFDIKSESTGNYAIELECEGKPSGLNVTTADYWVIVDKKYMIWVTPHALWEIAKNLTPYQFITDNKQIKAYLIKKEKIIYSPYVSVIKQT